LLILYNESPDLTVYEAAYTELLLTKANVNANKVVFKFNLIITSPPFISLRG